jgi:type II secretory ATPase GspE/PulE/Tfp pilus assembly ATPase PilB-like protein
MLDTPAPEAQPNLANRSDAAPPPSAPVCWPSPPFGSYPGPAELHAPLACMLQGLNGRIARAYLIAIDFDRRVAELRSASAKSPIALRFDQFLSLTLTEPLSPTRRRARSETKEASAVLEKRTRTPYRLLLKGANSITGKTVGYVEKPAGLFLFPPVDDADRVIRMFLPKEACLHQELGPPIGKMLIEQKAASAEQVEQVAALQEELRSQKVGEILVKQQVVTAEELLKALELQASRPVMRVGEALIALGLIRPEQLDAVLAMQKTDRSAPLGELLVRQQMISREDLRTALARKMGYPIVDVTRFPVEVNALRRVPYTVAQRLHVLPLVLNETSLVVGIEDVTRRAALDELEFITQTKVVPALASPNDIDQALRTAYARIGYTTGDGGGPDGAAEGSEESDARDVGKLAESLERDGLEAGTAGDEKPIEQSDNSLVRLINQMIIEAHGEGASDIHIECCPGHEKVKVRFRKDGALRPYIDLPHNYRNAVVSRIKVMCDLDISERRKPQDGKINFARFSPQHKIELRVATIPTTNGLEDVVMRLLASAKPIPLGDLGLSAGNLALFTSMIDRPYGLVLCVGPTGSGKTTTLHSALGHINRPERKIWTAEDPVEITQPGLRQVQVNPKIDWTFAKALRAFLRADPDVIMVGEVRDQETAHIVVEASLTGHLVLSTLHTNNAPDTVTRLLDMGVDTFNFADALIGVLAQRLVRAFCRHCRTERPASTAQVEELLADYLNAVPAGALDITRESLLADWKKRFGHEGRLMSYEAVGCVHCGGSGMQGRLGIHELMSSDRTLRRLIQTRASSAELLAHAMRSGMRTLRQDGIEKVLLGLTSIEEVRATSNES